MNATAQLSVEHGYATVRMTGDLDLASLPLLASVADWTTPHGDRPGLFLDLTQVDFLDFASARALATMVGQAHENPSLAVCAPGVVAKALAVSGFGDHARVVQVGLGRGERLGRSEVRLLMTQWPARLSGPAVP